MQVDFLWSGALKPSRSSRRPHPRGRWCAAAFLFAQTFCSRFFCQQDLEVLSPAPSLLIGFIVAFKPSNVEQLNLIKTTLNLSGQGGAVVKDESRCQDPEDPCCGEGGGGRLGVHSASTPIAPPILCLRVNDSTLAAAAFAPRRYLPRRRENGRRSVPHKWASRGTDGATHGAALQPSSTSGGTKRKAGNAAEIPEGPRQRGRGRGRAPSGAASPSVQFSDHFRLPTPPGTTVQLNQHTLDATR